MSEISSRKKIQYIPVSELDKQLRQAKSKDVFAVYQSKDSNLLI